MVKLFVEGGGNSRSSALNAECCEAFRAFITKAGVENRPKIVASGSRNRAYEDYCTALQHNEPALLLVDSEAPVAPEHQSGDSQHWQPWQHLKARDQWDKPNAAPDSDCHLMVQCMESWLVADQVALTAYFGNDFKAHKLPPNSNVEVLDKDTLYKALKQASRASQKDQYDKGKHSFELLKTLNPNTVCASSAWAQRFIDSLQVKLNAQPN